MQPSLNILVVEGSSNQVESLVNLLRGAGYTISSRQVTTTSQLEHAIAERTWDFTLCALHGGGPEVGEVVYTLDQASQDAPVIAVVSATERNSSQATIAALRAGAKDAVSNSESEHLRLVMERELHNLDSRRSGRRWMVALQERDKRWRALLESSRDPIAYVHAGMHVHANQTYLGMFGYDDFDELAALPLLDLVATQDRPRLKDFMRAHMRGDAEVRPQIELAGCRSDGNPLHIKMELSPATFEGEDCWQLVIRDQSENREVREQLEYLKFHDPATGLFNRAYFSQKLNESFEHDDDLNHTAMLLYLELDNFYVLRERLGIDATEDLVVNLARALQAEVDSGDALARLGDSVFGVLTRKAHISATWDLAESMRQSVESRILDMEETSVSTTCSIGICSMVARARTAEAALALAQTSCQAASKQGGNRIEIQFPARAGAMVAQTLSEPPSKLLSRVLERGELRLKYQPIVNLHEQERELYEVLLEICAHGKDPLPASVLWNATVDPRLLRRLDEWFIGQVVDVVASLVRESREAYFFLKLSEQAIFDEHILLCISKQLRLAQVPGNHLVLELSETAALTQVKRMKAFLSGLEELGCGVALNNFGLGLTSEHVLRHIPVDYLKLDASLVVALSSSVETQSAVRAAVQLATKLNKRIIANGVNDVTTLAALWDLGVHFVQGDGIQEPSESLVWDFAGSELG